MKEIYTIGVPSKLGCNVEGADLGIPLMQKDIIFDEILEIQNMDTYHDQKMKHIETISHYNEQLADKIYQSLLCDKKVITIGGDHSLAVGTVAGSSSYHKVGVLWIDSHGDINNEKVTETGNVHGFPLAACIGLGPQCLNDCYKSNTKVAKENIVIFGCSDLDKSEEQIIIENNLKVYRYLDIQNNVEQNIQQAVAYLKERVDTIHLSLDLDSIHPDIMPAVNVKTSANVGFHLEQIYKMLDIIFENISVQSVDIVEYNPLNDKNDLCYQEVVKLYQYIKNKMVEK